MGRIANIGRVFEVVTPGTKLTKGAADGFYIGTGGDLVLTGEDGGTATFAVTSGMVLPCGSSLVVASGTTASGIVALFGRA